jgi:hypothetical protein
MTANRSVQRIWCLTSSNSAKNLEGFIITSMTYNETKLLHWRSQTSRKSGEMWSGDLDIDDLTETNAIMVSEPTLACCLVGPSLIQITPRGVYLNGVAAKEVTVEERIVQASILDHDLALLLYHQSGSWGLLHLCAIESNPTEPRIEIQEIHQTTFTQEVSTLKLLEYRYFPLVFDLHVQWHCR